MTDDSTAASVAALLDAWEEMSAGYLPRRRESIDALVDELLARPAPITVLDLGSGPGTLLGLLATCVPGVRLVGIDHDPVLLQLASMHLASVAAPCELIDAPLNSRWCDHSALDEGVDVVVAMLVLHYFAAEQWTPLFEQVHDVLRPGGCFAIIDVTSEEYHLSQQSTEIDWVTWWAIATSSELPGLEDRFTERQARHTPEPAEYHPHLATIERIAHTTGFTALDVPLRVGPSYLAIARIDHAAALRR
jgi:cyclopropane fatty-acyl-phospholipid synthase-like methyltransferase